MTMMESARKRRHSTAHVLSQLITQFKQTTYTEWYFNEAANGMVAVPDGWVAIEGRYPEEMEDDAHTG